MSSWKSHSVPLENCRVLQMIVPYSSRGMMMLIILTAIVSSGESGESIILRTSVSTDEGIPLYT